jgi:hypothetical protein
MLKKGCFKVEKGLFLKSLFFKAFVGVAGVGLMEVVF